MLKKLVAQEVVCENRTSYVAEIGHKYTVFEDPVTGKFYRPVDGFTVTGNNLEDRFIEDDQLTISNIEDCIDKTFEEVIKEVMKWLATNHHPHTTIIVTSTTAELVEGIESVNTTEFLTD